MGIVNMASKNKERLKKVKSDVILMFDTSVSDLQQEINRKFDAMENAAMPPPIPCALATSSRK